MPSLGAGAGRWGGAVGWCGGGAEAGQGQGRRRGRLDEVSSVEPHDVGHTFASAKSTVGKAPAPAKNAWGGGGEVGEQCQRAGERGVLVG